MRFSSANVMFPAHLETWHQVPWRRVHQIVTNLRHRIYRARVAGDLKRVGNLQKLLLKATSNALQSIRQVTQLNAGRKTAGIDHVVVKTPQQRLRLLQQLKGYTTQQIQPVKRVWIPKADGKQRPLGLPTILDRCQQAIVKAALEPAWEAKFEATSYGFRPGRSAHDAIARVHCSVRAGCRRLWILDADIRGAFDHISHAFLEKQIGNFPGRRWIHGWLKAGVMESGKRIPTQEGTPQGGVISPLLLNIALHGMEKAVGMERNSRQETKPNSCAIVRYADDCVAMAHTKQACERVQHQLQAWLKLRGLELSERKTHIVHMKQGFDFLGYQIRHYRTKARKRGTVCLAQPSKESVATFRRMMKQQWRRILHWPLHEAISHLNRKIQGWCQYYQYGASKQTFVNMDRWMWGRYRWYVRRRHPNKRWWWLRKRYFGSIKGRADRWVFKDAHTGVYLWKCKWTRIKRHVLVRGRASPDDPNRMQYWHKRQAHPPRWLPYVRYWLWWRQRGKCPYCTENMCYGQSLDVHHHIPRSEGGTDRMDNLSLLHESCHQQHHAQHSADGQQPTA